MHHIGSSILVVFCYLIGLLPIIILGALTLSNVILYTLVFFVIIAVGAILLYD